MRLPIFFVAIAVCLCITGCNKQSSPDDEAAMDLPDWLNGEGTESESGVSRKIAKSSDKDSKTETDSTEQVTAAVDSEPNALDRPAREPREPRGELKLQLQLGDRFPLKKQVITTLVQTSSDQTQQTIQTDLRLLMAIEVEELKEGRTRLGVRYSSVEFRQSMEGQQLVYQSAKPPAVIPVAAQAYHDMVNDGFSFWINQDNQIGEVIGFQEFLTRCLKNVPAELQKQTLLGMEVGTDENGISDFVDNTIGILPMGEQVSPGYEWTRHRNVGRPIPMVIQRKYTLQELTPAEAVVKITGEIIPSQTIHKVSHTQQQDINVNVLGGSTYGQCTIFRDTGLPKESYTERVVNMTVDLGNGHVFDQVKTVQTRVEAFPSQPGQ